MGRKERTLPTPAQTPSIKREWSQGLTPTSVKKVERAATPESMAAPRKSCIGAPNTLKVR